LVVVQDAYNRCIIGWTMGNTQEAQLVIDAMKMAIIRHHIGIRRAADQISDWLYGAACAGGSYLLPTNFRFAQHTDQAWAA